MIHCKGEKVPCIDICATFVRRRAVNWPWEGRPKGTMAEKYRFEVRVTGEKISPENLHIREIADFLISVEEMVATVVSHNHPNLDFQASGVLRLSSLKDGSVDLACSSQFREAGPALREVGNVVEGGDISRLPDEARPPVLKLLKFSRDHNSFLEIREADGSRTQLLQFSPDTAVTEPAIPTYVTGTTTLYGELLRIGGDNPPTARMRFIDGMAKSCPVESTDLARSMARRLYETLGVRGKGEWEAESMQLHTFRIEQLTEYRKTSLSKAFESLSEVAAKHYADLEDVQAFVADLRGKGPEDE